jgi:hypothetical protein
LRRGEGENETTGPQDHRIGARFARKLPRCQSSSGAFIEGRDVLRAIPECPLRTPFGVRILAAGVSVIVRDPQERFPAGVGMRGWKAAHQGGALWRQAKTPSSPEAVIHSFSTAMP